MAESQINSWQYLPSFDFQYGEWMRSSFENGEIPWLTYELRDLTIIITQVLLKSEALYGPEPRKLLPPIPYGDFIKAMLHDLDRLFIDLYTDTRNVLLTLARIWSSLATNKIRSKQEAADWVVNHLPQNYQIAIKRAKNIYMGLENKHWNDLAELLKPCAKFMLNEINKLALLIDFYDQSKLIGLAKEPSK